MKSIKDSNPLFKDSEFMVYKTLIWYFVAVFVIMLLFQLILLLFTRFERTITIDSNLAYGSGSGKYSNVSNMVGDTEGRVYKIRNVLLLWKFRAAEIQATLKSGNSYKVKGYGLRIPFLGMYPTIYDAEKTTSK